MLSTALLMEDHWQRSLLMSCDFGSDSATTAPLILAKAVRKTFQPSLKMHRSSQICTKCKKQRCHTAPSARSSTTGQTKLVSRAINPSFETNWRTNQRACDVAEAAGGARQRTLQIPMRVPGLDVKCTTTRGASQTECPSVRAATRWTSLRPNWSSSPVLFWRAFPALKVNQFGRPSMLCAPS